MCCLSCVCVEWSLGMAMVYCYGSDVESGVGLCLCYVVVCLICVVGCVMFGCVWCGAMCAMRCVCAVNVCVCVCGDVSM